MKSSSQSRNTNSSPVTATDGAASSLSSSSSSPPVLSDFDLLMQKGAEERRKFRAKCDEYDRKYIAVMTALAQQLQGTLSECPMVDALEKKVREEGKDRNS
eukprot:PhM_4_TR16452/c1_g2_i3/m.96014